jgi:hypothetical protein
MLERMKGLAGAVAVLAVAPAAAGAATFSATASSPRNPALDASQDLSEVTAAFDTVGSFWLDMRVYGGTPSGITGTVYAAAATGGCGALVGSIVRDPDGVQSATLTPPSGLPRSAQGMKFRLATGQFAGQMSDSDLAGITPGCVTVTSSNSSGVVDTLESIPLVATASPPSSPFPAPTPTPTPTPTPPGSKSCTVTWRLGAPLRANRRGVVAIRLGRFSCRVKATIQIRSLTSGRTLGSRTYRANAGRPVARVRLNASSRRRLARGRTLNVRLIATARVSGTNIESDVPTTIRRR